MYWKFKDTVFIGFVPFDIIDGPDERVCGRANSDQFATYCLFNYMVDAGRLRLRHIAYYQ